MALVVRDDRPSHRDGAHGIMGWSDGYRRVPREPDGRDAVRYRRSRSPRRPVGQWGPSPPTHLDCPRPSGGIGLPSRRGRGHGGPERGAFPPAHGWRDASGRSHPNVPRRHLLLPRPHNRGRSHDLSLHRRGFQRDQRRYVRHPPSVDASVWPRCSCRGGAGERGGADRRLPRGRSSGASGRRRLRRMDRPLGGRIKRRDAPSESGH